MPTRRRNNNAALQVENDTSQSKVEKKFTRLRFGLVWDHSLALFGVAHFSAGGTHCPLCQYS
jgi:hypothetical protein